MVFGEWPIHMVAFDADGGQPRSEPGFAAATVHGNLHCRILHLFGYSHGLFCQAGWNIILCWAVLSVSDLVGGMDQRIRT